MSGLQVSFQESELYCSRDPSEDQVAWASLLGMKLGHFPVRYLGVPFISGRLKYSDCHPLIERITSRIHSWTAKYLSFAGRLQLIDSTVW